MATTREVREAVADALSSEFGSAWNVESRPPDSVSARSLIVGSIDWQDQTMDGGRVSTIPVWVVVSRKNPAFIDDLDEVCDPGEMTSVSAAIDADPTLGGVVASCRVESAGNYRDLEIAGTDYYGATVVLEVFH